MGHESTIENNAVATFLACVAPGLSGSRQPPHSDATRPVPGFRSASWMEKNKGFNPILQEAGKKKFLPSR